MWVRSKKWLVGWLALFLLLVLQLPIYSDTDPSEMTDLEIIEELQKSLTARENRLNEREQRLNEREQRLNEIELYYRNLKEDAKNEYLRGFLNGSLIGLAVGVGAGGYGGFSLGIRVRIPTGS